MNEKTWLCKPLAVVVAVAALSSGLALADEKRQPSSPEGSAERNAVTETDSGPVRMVATPGAPDMTEAEFQLGTDIYFQHCVVCHGALREGATGKPLTPDITQARGEAALNTFITYGMGDIHNWGTSGMLTKEEISVIARYIMHKSPVPPLQGKGNTLP
ncbi:cytochrome c [Halomonas sp. NyZ770]|uniref:c-type cytochrome n=1 Tax=Halomonas sp. NyZ770 TaxID=2883106 RepID=UPI001D0A34A0|nr:cytochrome c [Halomonas sp. NyZ770]UDM06194.1 cytochrome c [Halomonas sp. NyZ770]WGL63609.1 cytochrome c [Pseudomonas sp. CW003PS]